MRSVSRETLKRIIEEFPTVAWSESELDELVSPSLGVITGFQELVNSIEALTQTDLGHTPMVGALRRVTRAQ
jgi:hypothetical protein